MILYHFTSFANSQRILAEGALKPHRTRGRRTLPPVVWLTADGDRESVCSGWHGTSDNVLLTAMRFTVDVADAVRWREWPARHGRTVPAGSAAEAAAYKPRWYVAERAIPAAEWAGWDWAVSADQFIAALEEEVAR